MKTTFELIQEYFNSDQYDCKEGFMVDYILNGTTIKIQYKKYVEWITKDGKDESWWDYDNYIEVELLDYITFLFNIKKIIIMKTLINSKYMKWFRKLFLQYLYNKLSIHMEKYSKSMFLCCVDCIYGKFISWKDLKEVRDNLDSKYLSYFIKESGGLPGRNLVWFDRNIDRLLFLEECLDKFK